MKYYYIYNLNQQRIISQLRKKEIVFMVLFLIGAIIAIGVAGKIDASILSLVSPE